MKKLAVVSLVIIIAAMSVIAVSAAPRGGYYDQIGNKYWCNSDSYGCWVTGEDGGHEYIMFWSEAAAAAIMGPNSGAPVGTLPGTSTLNLAAPVAEAAAAAKKSDEGGDDTLCGGQKCASDEECVDKVCKKKSDGGDPTPAGCTTNDQCGTDQKCDNGTCVDDSGSEDVCGNEDEHDSCTGDWYPYPTCRCETYD